MNKLNFQLQIDSAAQEEMVRVNNMIDNHQAGPGELQKIKGKQFRMWEVPVAEGRTMRVRRAI